MRTGGLDVLRVDQVLRGDPGRRFANPVAVAIV
jgi:hypothetical protein